jgi:Na+-transporting NADH:ubiquinone oxidoreductase subunit F
MTIIFLAIAVTTGTLVLLAAVLLLAERRLTDYGNCRISINDGHTVFEQAGGNSLLNALYDQEIFIPSGCGGKGSCGYCKVTVHNGGGPVLPTELPFLSRREVLSGVRLACQVKIRGDIDLSIPEALLNVRRFQARVARSTSLTGDIRQIDFELAEADRLQHHPGQYIQVQVPSPDGPVFRAYSISSPNTESRILQLLVRLIPGGIASDWLHRLNPGDEVLMTGPYGDFRISDDPGREIICVGGGCGMAPMRSIIHSIHKRWPNRPCRLFFGCRTASDAIYLDEYRQMARQNPSFKLVYAVSEPTGGQWDGETGFIHLAVDKHLQDASGSQAFLCGPPPMIEAVTAVLKTKGMPESDIFYDKF